MRFRKRPLRRVAARSTVCSPRAGGEQGRGASCIHASYAPRSQSTTREKPVPYPKEDDSDRGRCPRAEALSWPLRLTHRKFPVGTLGPG